MSTKGDARRRAILSCIQSHTAATGYPPTLREIGDAVGLDAPGVSYHLGLLRDAGLVTWRPRGVRSVRVGGGE